jgi:hypothetical protein
MNEFGFNRPGGMLAGSDQQGVMPRGKMKNSDSKTPEKVALLLVIVFAVFLYLQMTTISIYEDYQQGIGKIRIFSPELLVLGILISTVVHGRFGIAASYMAAHFSKLANYVCVAFAGLYVALKFIPSSSHWSFPHERTLWKTLQISLTHPDFSNRSFARLFINAVLVLILGWLSRKLLLKRHNQEDAPDLKTVR